jgi:hypothetical protein
MPEDQRFYLRELVVKTVLIIPLTSDFLIEHQKW